MEHQIDLYENLSCRKLKTQSLLLNFGFMKKGN